MNTDLAWPPCYWCGNRVDPEVSVKIPLEELGGKGAWFHYGCFWEAAEVASRKE
jgi:hypothetical protein